MEELEAHYLYKFRDGEGETKKIAEGVELTMVDEDGLKPASLKFDKQLFDKEKAEKWVEDHRDVFDFQTFDLEGVEVFSVGTWNGNKIDMAYLQELKKSFDETRGMLRPYLKLGHDDNQKLLQKDGFAAAGFVKDLRIEGKKLVADFTELPKKIFNLIMRKAYNKVSCEIYHNVDIEGNRFGKWLGAVSLLGANTPGVMNLSDILGNFSLNKIKHFTESGETPTIIEYVTTESKRGESMEKTEREIQLEAELAAAQEKAEKYSADLEASEGKITELETANQEQAEKIAAAEAKEAEAKVDSFISEKLTTVSPAMKPMVKALLGEDKEEYSFEDEKKFSKQDLIKEMLELHAKALEVNLEETSIRGKEDFSKNSEDEQLEKIETYAKENEVSFADAYKAIVKGGE